MGGFVAQVVAQAIGLVATIVYTDIVTFILLKLVQMAMGLRVDEGEESQGLDISQHDETDYNPLAEGRRDRAAAAPLGGRRQQGALAD